MSSPVPSWFPSSSHTWPAPPLPSPLLQVGNARFATGHFLEAAYLFKFFATSTELQVCFP